MPDALDHLALYRMPWSFSDNVIAWLEPTAKCNLACEGCYRANADKHKSLDEIRADMECFRRYRNFDGVSIAGGDPLMHPQIVDIVRLVAEKGYKPILNTNGMALTRELLRELQAAGLKGFTFHVDSKQGRPGWKDKSEVDLNQLRLCLAELVAEARGISCAFNATVYEDTLSAVPELVNWAADHIDRVHVMVFIAYRAAVLDGSFDYYRGGQRIDPEPLAYVLDQPKRRIDITSREMVDRIRERFPDFAPGAYLGGTEKPDSLKWLMATRFGWRGEVVGYAGPRFMELTQTAHHLATGRYLAYGSPRALRMGRSSLLLAPFDRGVAGALKAWLRAVLRRPWRLFRPLHVQTVMFVQPIDILPDGRQNMCDACPDVTVHDGKLVWSCRLEECLSFGEFVQTVPRGHPAGAGMPIAPADRPPAAAAPRANGGDRAE